MHESVSPCQRIRLLVFHGVGNRASSRFVHNARHPVEARVGPAPSLLVQKNVRMSPVAVMARAMKTRSSSTDVQGNGQLWC